MQMNDMILVSVDDHVCEPPDMWKNHVPAKWKDRAPRLLTKEDGTNLWVFEGAQIPNVGLNAVAGPPAGGVRPGADCALAAAARLLRRRRAHRRHERQRHARLPVLPLGAGLRR